MTETAQRRIDDPVYLARTARAWRIALARLDAAAAGGDRRPEQAPDHEGGVTRARI